MKHRLRVHVEDTLDETHAGEKREMAMVVSSVVRFIETVWQEGHRILIHCRMGAQRSSCIIAAWLMYREPKFSADDAIRILKQKSPNAFYMNEVNFRQVLDDFDRRRFDKDMPDVSKVSWSSESGKAKPL